MFDETDFPFYYEIAHVEPPALYSKYKTNPTNLHTVVWALFKLYSEDIELNDNKSDRELFKDALIALDEIDGDGLHEIMRNDLPIFEYDVDSMRLYANLVIIEKTKKGDFCAR